MSWPEFCQLSELQRPLLNKFYRAHHCAMRASGKGQLWVARDGELLAGLSLTPVAHGHWLTGLFVAPAWRSQGIASQLVEQAARGLEGPLWLFCDPELQGFYAGLGFQPAPVLPPSLRDRLARYQRNKALIALGREPQTSAAGSSSGNNTSM